MSKNITWEELCEKAKEMGGFVSTGGTIIFSHLEFHEDGGIYIDREELDDVWVIPCVSSDRTPEEMLMIMEALDE